MKDERATNLSVLKETGDLLQIIEVYKLSSYELARVYSIRKFFQYLLSLATVLRGFEGQNVLRSPQTDITHFSLNHAAAPFYEFDSCVTPFHPPTCPSAGKRQTKFANRLIRLPPPPPLQITANPNPPRTFHPGHNLYGASSSQIFHSPPAPTSATPCLAIQKAVTDI